MLAEFGIGVIDLSAGVLLAIVVLMIISGKLVPRRTLEDVRSDRDARLTEAYRREEKWQEVAALHETGRRAAEQQVGILLSHSTLTTHVLTELKKATEAITSAQNEEDAAVIDGEVTP